MEESTVHGMTYLPRLFSHQIAIDIENESKQQNKYLDGMVSLHINYIVNFISTCSMEDGQI